MLYMFFQVDKAVVQSYIPQLLEALLKCFNDDSWPVRDGEASVILYLK